MRKALGFLILGIFLFWASLVSAAQVMVKDFQTEKGTVSVWKIAKALNHPGWDGVNALRKSDPKLPPLKKVGKIWDIRIFPNTRITIPDDWSYEGIDRSVVEPFPATPSLMPAEGFNSQGRHSSSPEKAIVYRNQDEPHSLWWFLRNPFIGLPFLVVIALVLFFLSLFRQSRNHRRSAVGQPIVPGGISPDRPQEIEDRFNRIAERRYGESNPQADLSVERPVRVSPIEAGFLNGHGTVVYRDKPRKEKMKDEPGFRARYRFPNGSEEELLFKQACGNDVYAGTRYHGFTFTASQVIVPAPAPAVKASVATQVDSTQTVESAEIVKEMAPVVSEKTEEAAKEKETAAVSKTKKVMISITNGSGKVVVIEAEGDSNAMPDEIQMPDGMKISFPKH